MNSITRRYFLEEAMLAAAAAAITPATPLLAADKPSTSPNEKLSVAVIGVRGRGQAHAAAYAARPDCEVTYVCDVDSEIGAAYAKQLAKTKNVREPKFVQDMRRIFEDNSVDIVSIATPNHWHTLAAIWAMQAGKDVYVEKPVSHNLTEGRRLVQVSRKYNRICQAGTQHRSNGSNRAAARYVQSGKLGSIKLARCVMHRGRKPIGPAGQFTPPASVDYNLWAGPAPMGPVTRKSFHYDWHWFWDYGNGEIGNNNVHTVDMTRLVLGLQGLGRGVICYGTRTFDDAAQTPNTQVTIHDFDTMTLVEEVRNLKTPAPRYGGAMVVMGSEGYLVGNFGKNVVFDPAGKQIEVINGQGDDHFANFLKAVRSRKREEQNAEILEGHQSAAIVHLANISYRLGHPTDTKEVTRELAAVKANENNVETFEQTVQHLKDNGVDTAKLQMTLGPCLKFDSEKETFPDNAAANALLTREYRKPFVVPAADAI